MTTLVVVVMTAVISTAQDTSSFDDIISDPGDGKVFTIDYDLENHPIELSGCDVGDEVGESVDFMNGEENLGGIRWVMYASYFIIHAIGCDKVTTAIPKSPYGAGGKGKVFKVAISREEPEMVIKVFMDGELVWKKIASQQTCGYWLPGSHSYAKAKGPITQLKMHSVFRDPTCFDRFNPALLNDNSGTSFNLFFINSAKNSSWILPFFFMHHPIINFQW